ncbi:MAG: TIGR02265 family protein [Gemmatimonadota bacterium]
MQQVKGSVLKSRLGFVESHFGEAGVKRVLESLSPEDQQALNMILTVKWYPFEIGKRLDNAIVQVLGGGRPEFFERLGEASADKNLTTLHHGFMTEGRPHAFLSKAPAIYALYYETGRREYQQTGETSGVLTTHGAETFSTADCLTVVGWYRRALQMCGARDVKVVEDECRATGGKVCRYNVSWSA